MANTKKSYAINRLLYRARLDRHETLKRAAHSMHMHRLRLKLIENGYLDVPKKLQQRFIDHYHLPKNFFTVNSTYSEPIKEDLEKKKDIIRIRKLANSRRLRVFCGITIGVSLVTLALGIFYANRNARAPREAWSKDFITFRQEIMKHGITGYSKSFNDNYYYVPNENKYTFELNVPDYGLVELDGEIQTILYEKEVNAADTNIYCKFTTPESSNEIEHAPSFTIVMEATCYNKKKIVFISYIEENMTGAITVPSANCIIEDRGKFNLRPFRYNRATRSDYIAQVGDKHYEKLRICMEQLLPQFIEKYNNDYLPSFPYLQYKDFYDVIDDIGVISRNYILNLRLGFHMTLSSALVFAFTNALMFLSFAVPANKKVEISENVNMASGNSKEGINFSASSLALPGRSHVNDIKVPLIFPEFFLRFLGLSIILLFAVALNLSVYWQLNISMIVPNATITAISNLSSNMLIAGTTLLFFLRLDVFSRKNRVDLLTNIFWYFIYGLGFYVIEVVLYSTFMREFANTQNMLTKLGYFIATYLPGNIFWNLTIYFVIFYFLFITPARFQNKPHSSLVKFRCCSLIPTAVLIFSFIFTYVISPMTNAPYILTCAFSTGSLAISLFALLYMYTTYFFQVYCIRRYGKDVATIYFYSKRFSFTKNVYASIIITLIVIADLCFHFLMPNNVLGLGNSWMIMVLVPLILFYFPHIGSRSARWDNVCEQLYSLFYLGAYLGAAIQVLTLFDMSALLELIH